MTRGKSEWSPELAEAIKVLLYWRARNQYKSDNLVVKKLGEDTGFKYKKMSDISVQNKLFLSGETLDDIGIGRCSKLDGSKCQIQPIEMK